jgi:hypothetical protein
LDDGVGGVGGGGLVARGRKGRRYMLGELPRVAVAHGAALRDGTGWVGRFVRKELRDGAVGGAAAGSQRRGDGSGGGGRTGGVDAIVHLVAEEDAAPARPYQRTGISCGGRL